jgi:hypothetical protein
VSFVVYKLSYRFDLLLFYVPNYTFIRQKNISFYLNSFLNLFRMSHIYSALYNCELKVSFNKLYMSD